MTRVPSVLALAALLALPTVQSDARPAAIAKAQPNAAIKARQAVMKGFDARMSRLDTLMGAPAGVPARAPRARSADAAR